MINELIKISSEWDREKPEKSIPTLIRPHSVTYVNRVRVDVLKALSIEKPLEIEKIAVFAFSLPVTINNLN